MDTPWQIVHIVETNEAGVFRVWALVGSDLHQLRLVVPRIFYVNQRTPKQNDEASNSSFVWRKVQKTLPRAHPVLNLYEYKVPEEVFRRHACDLITDLSTPGKYIVVTPNRVTQVWHLLDTVSLSVA